jgi:hypothetical protein
MTMKKILSAATASLALCAPTFAGAAVVLAPVAATVEVGGDAGVAYGITNVFDQSGLSDGYESGVTDFDEFLSFDPKHSTSSAYREWFAESGQTVARIVFDLGAVYQLSSLALWNEEAGGASRIKFSTLTQAFADVSPADNPAGGRFYGAERFDFAPISTRYIVMEMSGCPQGDGAYVGCSLGEIAFGGLAEATGGVPEPATWAMMILGLGGVGAVLRRRSRIYPSATPA